MTDDDAQRMVAESYTALADLLGGLRDNGWDAASLCEGWRIREVVAHVTMPVRYDEDAFMAELRDCEFDFTKLSNRIAARDAALPTADLLANLRDPALHAWTPPGGGADRALDHVVIHGLDVTVALDAPRASSDTAIRTTLDGLTRGGGHDRFGTVVAGRRLEAIDVDWSYGAGALLSGVSGDLVAHLAGRRVPAGRLHGEPLARAT
jgi:uncharacterized protein (TIGR03083 family)